MKVKNHTDILTRENSKIFLKWWYEEGGRELIEPLMKRNANAKAQEIMEKLYVQAMSNPHV